MPYISMPAEVLQKLDFSQGTLRQDLLAEDICNLLYGNPFLSLVVGRRTVVAYLAFDHVNSKGL